MARPSRAELREGFEAAGERVADDEGLLGILGASGSGSVGGGPEIEEAVGGGDGVEAGEGKEGEGEFEPLIGDGVEGMEGEESGDMAVGGLESEEGEWAGLGAKEVVEGGRGESAAEGFADALGGGDLAEGQVAEDLVEGILG